MQTITTILQVILQYASLSNGNQTLTLKKNNGTTVSLTNTDNDTTYVASEWVLLHQILQVLTTLHLV